MEDDGMDYVGHWIVIGADGQCAASLAGVRPAAGCRHCINYRWTSPLKADQLLGSGPGALRCIVW